MFDFGVVIYTCDPKKTKLDNHILIVSISMGQFIRLRNSYTMGCPPVRGDFSEWTGGYTLYNYFIPPTSIVVVFNVPPTAKVIWRRGPRL